MANIAISTSIKRYMINNGISQEFISSKTGIPLDILNAILDLKRNLASEEYFIICEALNVPLQTFKSSIIKNMPAMADTKSLSIHEAAEIMGKSDQFIRIGLQRGILPFGSAVKLSSRWTYYISPTKFYEYVGKIS